MTHFADFDILLPPIRIITSSNGLQIKPQGINNFWVVPLNVWANNVYRILERLDVLNPGRLTIDR